MLAKVIIKWLNQKFSKVKKLRLQMSFHDLTTFGLNLQLQFYNPLVTSHNNLLQPAWSYQAITTFLLQDFVWQLLRISTYDWWWFDLICFVGLVKIEEDGTKGNLQKDYCLPSVTCTCASGKQHYRWGPLQHSW